MIQFTFWGSNVYFACTVLGSKKITKTFLLLKRYGNGCLNTVSENNINCRKSNIFIFLTVTYNVMLVIHSKSTIKVIHINKFTRNIEKFFRLRTYFSIAYISIITIRILSKWEAWSCGKKHARMPSQTTWDC